MGRPQIAFRRRGAADALLLFRVGLDGHLGEIPALVRVPAVGWVVRLWLFVRPIGDRRQLFDQIIEQVRFPFRILEEGVRQ